MRQINETLEVGKLVFWWTIRKYMIFETQLYKIWELDFNMKSNIAFMYYEPTPFFVPRLPLWVSIINQKNR